MNANTATRQLILATYAFHTKLGDTVILAYSCRKTKFHSRLIKKLVTNEAVVFLPRHFSDRAP